MNLQYFGLYAYTIIVFVCSSPFAMNNFTLPSIHNITAIKSFWLAMVDNLISMYK